MPPDISLAPLLLFVYNRPDHTRRTIAALSDNYLASATRLIVFSDGPKSADDVKHVNQIRRSLREVHAFKSVTVIERDTNMGLSASIIDGISQVIKAEGHAIVVEDDIVTSPYFLEYMNNGLSYYEKDDRVISIHGYSYPTAAHLPSIFFLRGADCWGWATWRRGWEQFEPDAERMLIALKRQGLERVFDRGGFRFLSMLKNQAAGIIDSWAIRWHAAAFLAGKLTLYPGCSLVHNTGNDDSGTHCRHTGTYDVPLCDHPISIEAIPVAENDFALAAFMDFANRQHRFHIFRSIFGRFARQWGSVRDYW